MAGHAFFEASSDDNCSHESADRSDVEGSTDYQDGEYESDGDQIERVDCEKIVKWKIPVTVKLDDRAWLTRIGDIKPSWKTWGPFYLGAIDDIQDRYAGKITNESDAKTKTFKVITSAKQTKTWLKKVLDVMPVYDRLVGVREVCNETGGHEPAATVLAWRLYVNDSPWVEVKRLHYAEDSTRAEREIERIDHRNAVMKAMKEAARKLLYAKNHPPAHVVAWNTQDTQTWVNGLTLRAITKRIVSKGVKVSSADLNEFLEEPSVSMHDLIVFRARSWTVPSSLSRTLLEGLLPLTRLKLHNKARLEALLLAELSRIPAFYWARAIGQGWFGKVPVWGVSKRLFRELSNGASGDQPDWVLCVKALAQTLAGVCGCRRRPSGTDKGCYLFATVAPNVDDLSLPDGEQASPYSIGPAVAADPSLSSPWSAEKAFSSVEVAHELEEIKDALVSAGVFLYVGLADDQQLETRVKQHFTGGSTSSCLDTLLLAQDSSDADEQWRVVRPPSSFCVCYFSKDPSEEGEAVKWLIDNGLAWLLLNVSPGISKSIKP